MTVEQIASVEPALRELLKKFEKCFEDRRTRGHWLKYLLGLLTDVPRKSIEPLALAAGVPVRTLQEFLSQHRWDHERAEATLQRLVADEHAATEAIGVIDSCGQPVPPLLRSSKRTVSYGCGVMEMILIFPWPGP